MISQSSHLNLWFKVDRMRRHRGWYPEFPHCLPVNSPCKPRGGPWQRQLLQEKSIGLVVSLVPIGDIDTLQERLKGSAVFFIDLETHEDAPEIGAVIAIVEQADVPAIANLHQKI